MTWFLILYNLAFSPKLFRVEIRDEQVYDIVADDYGILWTIALEKLQLLEKQEWLIDVNLAIIYLLTNLYSKKNCQIHCICYVRSLHIQIS